MIHNTTLDARDRDDSELLDEFISTPAEYRDACQNNKRKTHNRSDNSTITAYKTKRQKLSPSLPNSRGKSTKP